MIPTWPDRALNAVAFLFAPFNDIDIYVEDKTCRNMYQILIFNILENKTKIVRIHSLGSRQKVLEKCKNDQTKSKRPKLYLIDGDLELINNDQIQKLRYLYSLKVYCSENLILLENAAVEVGRETEPNFTEKQIKKSINFKLSVAEAAMKLQPLFIWYAVAHKLQSGLATVNYNVVRLCVKRSNNRYLLKSRIDKRILELKLDLENTFGVTKVNKIYARAKKTFNKYSAVKLVSGKDYLLPLLQDRLKRLKLKDNRNQLKVRLARYCNSDMDLSFKRALLKSLRNK